MNNETGRNLPSLLLLACFLSMAASVRGQIAERTDTQTEQHRWPAPHWPSAQPAEVGLDFGKLQEAREYAESAGGSGMIVRHGQAVLRWGDQKKRYDIKSATKSIGTAALGIAIMDGKIDLKAPARKYHPTLGIPPGSNAGTGWLDEITILHLATQTAGFEKRGGYEALLFKPGTGWHYSDGGPNWLAECITLQYRRDLDELMFERVFTPLDITRDDLQWRRNQYRPHEIEGIPRREFGAGIHANVEALSRIGYLHLREGRWKDQQILLREFVRTATGSVESVVSLPEWDPQTHSNAPAHYGLLWWNNVDGELEGVPRDAYWAWGLHDSLIVVIPSLDLVVVRGGENRRSWPRNEAWGHYAVLKPFLEPIVAAVWESRHEVNSGAAGPGINDQPIPGTEEGSLTVQVEAGRSEKEFHVTFERNGAYYVSFDGSTWSDPALITSERPFRSGVHMAVAGDNTVHFAWVEGSRDRGGVVHYRVGRAGNLGDTERVHSPQGWNECDIAVDAAGAPIIVANTAKNSEIAIYERTDRGWTQTVLPSDNELDKWAPSIVCADGGLIYVAFRRKDGHPFTWQVRKDGQWSKDMPMPARSYEPNAIPYKDGLIAASLDGIVYLVESRDGEFVASHRGARSMKRGIIRGQHVGVGLTKDGTLVLSHSDMANPDLRDRTIRPDHRFYYSFSRDFGRTWTFNQPVAAVPGQGHGDFAANREWVMFAWPDIRGSIRYTVMRDPGAAPSPGGQEGKETHPK